MLFLIETPTKNLDSSIVILENEKRIIKVDDGGVYSFDTTTSLLWVNSTMNENEMMEFLWQKEIGSVIPEELWSLN